MLLRRVKKHIRQHIWDSCYRADVDSQMLVECELPVNEEDGLTLVTEFAADRELVHNLRFWMANLGVTLIVLDNQKSQGNKLIELIDASLADAR